MNNIYILINKLFKIDNNKLEKEKEIKAKLDEWENIAKTLYEKKFEIKDDNIKISLFKFFNNTKNIESYNKILKKESFNFLLDQKQEAMKEILLYYISFFPESMKKEIELIKSGQINDDNLEDYIPAKKFNLRKPFVFSLLN